MRIVLWDIDGTLVDTGGTGVGALARAVHASEGAKAALRRMRLGGMTDRKIARILCAAAHVRSDDGSIMDAESLVTDGEIDALLAIYVETLRTTIHDAPNYRVLAGVREALDALDGRVVHALGTGNLEEGARLKLERGGLWQRFLFGGYGSDAEERPDVLRAAVRRAEERYGTVALSQFVVVGDTPRDIAAAHTVGIACVAVASGSFTVHDLCEHGADAVLPDLTDPATVDTILTTTRR